MGRLGGFEGATAEEKIVAIVVNLDSWTAIKVYQESP